MPNDILSVTVNVMSLSDARIFFHVFLFTVGKLNSWHIWHIESTLEQLF